MSVSIQRDPSTDTGSSPSAGNRIAVVPRRHVVTIGRMLAAVLVGLTAFAMNGDAELRLPLRAVRKHGKVRDPDGGVQAALSDAAGQPTPTCCREAQQL